MDLSFQEKSTWGTLIIVIGAYGYYCLRLFGGDGQATSQDIAVLFISVVIAIIVAEIVYHVVIVIPFARDDAETEQDERDKFIEWRSESWGGLVLGAFTIMAIGHIVIREAFFPPADIMVVAHILIGGMVAAEVIKSVMQLIFYRRGI